ncbi:SDR family oxidoreductase [Streptomyces alfalfae]|uniref:SDR family oxidoreductase n=1 Tax=Streptomyces alfalfae TaxID=1642299 RepID=A0A7T4PL92_9ACTN|nr:SDR family oxidoreductase [Streptomyces alfalfae]QQC92386.1 SDR family oxidoreductase [Streptomyces alfalfae]
MLLTDNPRIAAHLAALPLPGPTLVACTVAASPGVIHLPRAEEAAIGAVWNSYDANRERRPLQHVRAFTDLRAAPWPQAPTSPLLTLQELFFLAAQHLSLHRTAGSSLAALILDPLVHGLPHPHAALLTGLVKNATWELPQMRTHAVVTDTSRLQTALDELQHESRVAGGLPVGYYRVGARSAEHLIPAPLTGQQHRNTVTDDSVIVAAGGARGITATALRGLTALSRPEIWLLGSTPVADLAHQAEAVGTTGRITYVRQCLAATPGVSVVEAGAQWDRLQHARQALHTLSMLRRQCGGTRVHYLTCDVTEPTTVKAAAEQIYRTSGRVDLLIHAAGIGRARTLRAKTLAAFRKVRSVKVDGYHHLKAAFADPAPAAWCTFSSIAGVLGLPGECDYGPANDTLNAAARYETMRGRDERAIAWTMWGESGLGPSSGFTDLTRRTGRLSLIGDAEGQRLFTTELTAPPGLAHAVPIYLGAPEQHTVAPHYPGLVPAAPAFAFFNTPARLTLCEPASAAWCLDLRPYTYLLGHRRNGRALLPGALAIELAVEAAHRLVPGGTAAEVTRIRFRAPIAAAPRDTRYELHATHTSHHEGRQSVHIEIRSTARPAAPERPRSALHFAADVILGSHRAQPRPSPCPPASSSGRQQRRGAEARLALPFDSIRRPRTDSHGVHALCRLDLTGQDLRHFSRMATCWLVIDAALQTAAFIAPGRLATPRSIGAVRLPGVLTNDHMLAASGTEIICTASPDRRQTQATVTTSDQNTTLVCIEDLELA